MNVYIWTMHQDTLGLSAELWEGKGPDKTNANDSETLVPERKQVLARKTF